MTSVLAKYHRCIGEFQWRIYPWFVRCAWSHWYIPLRATFGRTGFFWAEDAIVQDCLSRTSCCTISGVHQDSFGDICKKICLNPRSKPCRSILQNSLVEASHLSMLPSSSAITETAIASFHLSHQFSRLLSTTAFVRGLHLWQSLN